MSGHNVRRGIYQYLRRLYRRKQGYWQTFYPGREMPSFSNGWLRGFQSRWNIQKNIEHGEAGSLSQDAGAEMTSICQALSTYTPQDIYNCDETSLC